VLAVWRRSPYDREIFGLALPALGALAAEPLYVLVDTAIVGHLGTQQLAALAIAATLLTSSYWVCNFLTYGTTAQVARYHGAGREDVAGSLAAQALWLAIGIGAVVGVLLVTLADPLVALMGGDGHTADLAVLYLRISSIGMPFALIALAGQGYLRGVSNLRLPLIIVVVANLVNVVLEVLFVYGFDWGIAGSAWGTVIAQSGMAAAFVVALLRAPAADRRPQPALMRPLMRMGGDIAIRTGALLLSFAFASAVLARIGEDSLAAHQVAFQLWTFLALILDAVAIAGQVMIGRMLGAGHAAGATEAARRMIGLCVVFGAGLTVVMLALSGPLPHVFTDDADVIDRLAAIWPIFALMQPANAAVFALDGILIGAGDTRFLMWGMLASALLIYVPIALLSLELEWGIVGVWCGLVGLILGRLVSNGARFAGGRWAVTGATVTGYS
jgi:putative MATE family efflux protein